MNVSRWMQALKNGKQDVLTAFMNHMIGIEASFAQDNVFGYMDAFNTVCSSDEELAKILRDAASMFEKLFGFPSETFVASCFVWNRALEKELSQLGIRGIQSAFWQNEPVGQGGSYKLNRRIHFTGEKTPFGQYYTVRNFSFEPAYKNDPRACVQRCMSEVEKSFADRKPAIITSHRLNLLLHRSYLKLWRIDNVTADKLQIFNRIVFSLSEILHFLSDTAEMPGSLPLHHDRYRRNFLYTRDLQYPCQTLQKTEACTPSLSDPL